MYFNLKTIETNPDVAKYQPGRVREGIAFLLNCENSVSCSRHIIRSEWVEVCSLGPAVSPGSLNTLVHLLVVIPKMVKGQGRIIKWTAQEYCIQHSLAQGNNGMRYGGLWSQTADGRIKIKHYQELLLKINAQAQRWVSSLQRRAEQIYFSKEHISPHRSLIDRHLGVEGHQPANIVAPGRGYWAHSLHSCSSIRDSCLTSQHLLIPPSCLVTLALPKEQRNSASWVIPSEPPQGAAERMLKIPLIQSQSSSWSFNMLLRNVTSTGESQSNTSRHDRREIHLRKRWERYI